MHRPSRGESELISQLRTVRIAQGLGTYKLSEIVVGYPNGSIDRWESNRNSPYLCHFIRWAAALNLQVTLCPIPTQKQ